MNQTAHETRNTTIPQSFFDAVPDRRGTNSIKWDRSAIEKVCGNADALPFWVADMDFLSPPPVIEALKVRAAHGVFGYTMNTDAAFSAFREWAAVHHGWKPEWKSLVFSPGIVPALAAAVRAYTKPGDSVLIQTPAYRPFFDVISRNGRNIVENPLLYKRISHPADGIIGRYTLDLTDLEQKIVQNQVRLMIFCSPHNPAGRVWTHEELKKVYEIAEQHHVIVVSDEIHADLSYADETEQKHIPFSSIVSSSSASSSYLHPSANSRYRNRSVTCMAPSKTFNIPGEPFASIVIPDEELRNRFTETLEASSMTHPSLFALTAAESAYREGGPWLSSLLRCLQDNLSYMTARLRAELPESARIFPVTPEASYIAFLDMQDIETRFQKKLAPYRNITQYLGREAGIALHAGTWFGREGRGFVRINFGTPRAVLAEGLDRLIDGVRKLGR